jgi:ATP-dependent Clp protease protease subunit
MKTLKLSGVVGVDITAENIKKEIDEKSKEKLRIFVNSPGGSAFEAFQIYNFFKMYKGHIEFVINVYAASAMSYIIMAGDKISAFKNSIFMAHKVQSIAMGDADDIQRGAEITRAFDKIIVEAYSKKMDKRPDEIEALLKTELWAIGWEALTDLGIIDDVIDDIEMEEDAILTDVEDETKKTLIKRMSETAQIEAFKNSTTKLDFMQAAAYIDIETINNNGNKTKEEDKMIEKKIDEKGDNSAEIAEAVNSERTRIMAIMQKGGVVLSTEMAEAINEGQTVEQYASAELDRLRNKAPEKKSVFTGVNPPDAGIKKLEISVEDQAAKMYKNINSFAGGF